MDVRFYLSHDNKITLKSHFCLKYGIMLSFARTFVMDVITFPEILETTSGLSILLHGVISLPYVTAYEKFGIHNRIQRIWRIYEQFQ